MAVPWRPWKDAVGRSQPRSNKAMSAGVWAVQMPWW